jgi:hypothetical protein
MTSVRMDKWSSTFVGPKLQLVLKVSARLLRKRYERGESISAEEMQQLVLNNHKTLPGWNYTLIPATMSN